jgi:phosphohistidine phosphatase SixA
MAKFYLMRHCEAEEGEQLDTERGLTDTGKEQRKIVARFLETQTDSIGAVLCSSDLKRGIQTGEWLAEKLGVELAQSPYVDPPNNEGTVKPADIKRCWKVIQTQMKKLGNGQELLVVSHGPMINALAAYLIGSDQGARFHFSHGSVMHLDETTPADYVGKHKRGEGVICFLHWFASVKMMNRAMEQDQDAEVTEALALVDSMLAELGVEFELDEAGRKRPYTYEEILLKRWVLGSGGKSGNCETCVENSELGWIDSEETFLDSEGTDIDGTPAHPNCDDVSGCSIEYKESRRRVYL